MNYGGGGGSGFWGGAAGTSIDGSIGGGGGGSGFIGFCSQKGPIEFISGWSGGLSVQGSAAAPRMDDASYEQGVGIGGQGGKSALSSSSAEGNGGNGLVVIHELVMCRAGFFMSAEDLSCELCEGESVYANESGAFGSCEVQEEVESSVSVNNKDKGISIFVKLFGV